MSVNGNECAISFPNNYAGAATLKVRGINDCGEGGWSPDFEIMIDPCTGIFEQARDDIQILPNPNQGQFCIQLKSIQDESHHLEIFSAQGEKVYQSDIEQNSNALMQVALHNMASGIYYLKISGNSTFITKKIIVNR